MNYKGCIELFMVIALTHILLITACQQFGDQQDYYVTCLDVSFVDEIDKDEPSTIRTFVRDLHRKSANI
jgi:hypothetical protein